MERDTVRTPFDILLETSLQHVGNIAKDLVFEQEKSRKLAAAIYNMLEDGNTSGVHILNDLGYTNEDGVWIYD